MSGWEELERFDNPGARVSGSTVKITNQLAIYFSAGFLHKAQAQVGVCENCVLYYSKPKRAIVIDFIDDPENWDGAMKMTIKRSCAQVSARAFFSYNMIDTEQLRNKTFTPILTKIPQLEEDRWVIYLDG